MKKINLIIFLIFLLGFFQLILVYSNFRLMNKVANLEEKKKLLWVKLKKTDIRLDSLFTLTYSLKEKNLEIKLIDFSKKEIPFEETLRITEIAKKENGEE